MRSSRRRLDQAIAEHAKPRAQNLFDTSHIAPFNDNRLHPDYYPVNQEPVNPLSSQELFSGRQHAYEDPDYYPVNKEPVNPLSSQELFNGRQHAYGDPDYYPVNEEPNFEFKPLTSEDLVYSNQYLAGTLDYLPKEAFIEQPTASQLEGHNLSKNKQNVLNTPVLAKGVTKGIYGAALHITGEAPPEYKEGLEAMILHLNRRLECMGLITSYQGMSNIHGEEVLDQKLNIRTRDRANTISELHHHINNVFRKDAKDGPRESDEGDFTVIANLLIMLGVKVSDTVAPAETKWFGAPSEAKRRRTTFTESRRGMAVYKKFAELVTLNF